MDFRVQIDINVTGYQFKMEFDPDQLSQAAMIGTMMIAHEPYEKETTEFLCQALQPGSTFIDVGAHIGWFALLAAKIVGPLGKVLALEPEPENYRLLKRHLEMNAVNGMVRCKQAAAASKDAPVILHLNADNDGGHSLWPCQNYGFNRKTKECPKTLTVEGITLDTLCESNGLSSVDLLKIDTEGAEVEVLLGAKRMLRDHALRHVILEVNEVGLKEMGTDPGELKDLMFGFGYSAGVPLGTVEPGMVYNLLFTPES